MESPIKLQRYLNGNKKKVDTPQNSGMFNAKQGEGLVCLFFVPKYLEVDISVCVVVCGVFCCCCLLILLLLLDFVLFN